MRNRARRVILVESAFVLASCSHELPVLERKSPQAAGFGVVVLSVSHDLVEATETSAYFYLDEKVLGGRGLLATPFRQNPSDFTTRRGQVLALSLTPGTHTIDRWQLETTINMRKPKYLPVPLAFQVREGEIVYIGNLHLRFQVESGLLDATVIRAVVPIVQDKAFEDIEAAVRKVPGLRDRVAVRLLPLGPWRTIQP